MNAPRSDASTSTDDDLKSRPLCLFYFTHPFGVLSPEPPRLADPPPHFAHMSASYFTASSEDYNTATTTPSTGLGFDLGAAHVHRNPLRLVSVADARRCTVRVEESLPSSLLSSELWFSSGSSGRGAWARLPPLRLPASLGRPPSDSDGDPWPGKCLYPTKFSLPPIDTAAVAATQEAEVSSVEAASGASGGARLRARRRRAGVAKRRGRGTRQLSGARRTLACLMRRTVWGESILFSS
ncbi:hypothetical protein ACJJTC_014555 [Scirpophaga incertulas]